MFKGWKLYVVGMGILGLCVGTYAEPVHLEVSPNGDLTSIEEARDKIRSLRKAQADPQSYIVDIQPGEYFVTEPVVFSPQDSGTKEHPITYRAVKEGTVILHGGRKISEWRQEGPLWIAQLPQVRNRTWSFSSFWIDGQRRQPARTPNPANPWGDNPPDSDFFHTAGPVMDGDKKSHLKFQYVDGDIENWPSLRDAVVVTFHSWATSLSRIKSIDRNKRIVEFTGPARWAYGRWQPDQRYFIEHLFEGLDQPGEWFLNRRNGMMFYYPMPGEKIREVNAVAPVAQQLLVLTGQPEEGKYVEYLNFEGLNLQYTEYPIAREGHSDAQAAFRVHAALETMGARHNSFENMTIKNVSNYGVWFRRGSHHNRLRHSEITDMGAGGVRIGEGGSPATPGEAAEYNEVDNNFIHEGGRIFRSAVGVWIGRSSYNKVTHNEICDFRYTGVSVGWSWGYAESSAHHNNISYNHIHHIGLSQLNDMGGIYCLGVSPGTVLKGNLIHDVISHPRLYGGWGLYTDEGSTDIVLEDNLVYNTRTGGFHQHYGRDNIVRNNIFAYSHGPQIIRTREEEHNSFTFENNIVYFNTGQALGSNWRNQNWKIDKNVYWDTSGQDIEFSGRSFKEWQAQGNDVHSLVADPGFVDGQSADFRLKPDAAALKTGFKPFDFTKAGLYGDKEWVSKPKAKKRPLFTPPPVAEPEAVFEDFEKTAVESAPSNVQIHEDGSARARVTDEVAAKGKHSLKISDAAGLKKSYNPHVVYTPHLRSGVVHGEFYVRFKEGGDGFYHEWRDSRSPYRVGPSVWFREGNVLNNGKKLMHIPNDTWAKISIDCGVGRRADGTYSLTIEIEGQPAQHFEKVPVINPKFNRLDWFGFVSNSSKAVTTYIDEVQVNIK